MDWLMGIHVAVLALASPLVAVLVTAVVCVLLLVLIAALVGVPMPWRNRRRAPDFVPTEPAAWNPAQRPLHTAQVPPRRNHDSFASLARATPAPPMPPMPVIRNMSSTPINVHMLDGSTRVIQSEDKDCCGACDGSKCGDKPARSASALTPIQLHRSLSATPGRNPTRPLPTPSRPTAAPAPAARRRDDDDAPFSSSTGRTPEADPPAAAPAPAFHSGLGGDFGGAGASGAWASSDDNCRAPAPSPSYDSGSSSGDSGSDSGGGGCGD